MSRIVEYCVCVPKSLILFRAVQDYKKIDTLLFIPSNQDYKKIDTLLFRAIQNYKKIDSNLKIEEDFTIFRNSDFIEKF